MIPEVIVSYAQNFEDVLLWRVLHNVGPGFYIDIGAQDPTIDSVSRGFYEQGWRGIHVEPSAHYAHLLRQDRPDEMVIQAAITEKAGLLTFFEVPNTGSSTAIPELADYAAKLGNSNRQITVAAVTLDDILTLADGRTVHWLKIDVEGLEHEVLRGWRESSVRPWIVLLESITPWREHAYHVWEPLLLEKGYEFAYFDGLNRYYVLESRSDLKVELGYGPSVWDQFRVSDNSRLLSQTCLQNRDRAVSLAADLHAATAHRDDLQTALNRSQQELAAAREEFETTSSELAKLQAAYQDLNVRARHWSSELDTVRSELGCTRSDLAELRVHYAALEDNAIRSSTELERKSGELVGLLGRYAALEDSAFQLAAELDGRRVELTALRASYDEVLQCAECLSDETMLLRRTLTQVRGVVEEACSETPASIENQSSFQRNPVSSASPQDEPADSLEELLSYYDEAFVRKAYVTLLKRVPDPTGLEHFLHHLRAGHSRLLIIEEIRNSEEGKRLKAGLRGLDEALLNQKRERSFRAKLWRLLHGHTSGEGEIAPLVSRIGEQVAGFEHAHKAAGARISDLHARIREIARILEKPLDPASRAPFQIVSVEGSAGHLALVEQEMRRAFLQIGAETSESAQGHYITAIVGKPDIPLELRLRPAILIIHDWDESGYPATWVDSLNAQYLAVGCTTTHACKILIDHGVTIPVAAIGYGTDHCDRIIPADLPDPDGKSFRFVHIVRRPDVDGTELALRSFARVFRKSDDVSLVVACTDVMEAEIRALIEAIRGGDQSFPDVLLALRRWTDGEIKSLFARSDVLIAPTRAAEFSLDIALAFYSGLDVIATRWGGHLDYCSDDNAWLVDFDFERSASQRSILVSAWTRVKDSSLDEALRSAHASSTEARAARTRAGRERLSMNFSWEAVASRFMELSQRSEKQTLTRPRRRVGWITTWNTKCGIASAASHMIRTLPPEDVFVFAAVAEEAPLGADGENCRRIWRASKTHNELGQIVAELDQWSIGALVIHFNYGFFNHAELGEFIERVTERGTTVIMDLHATIDPKEHDPNFRLDTFLSGLQKCHRILAHTVADLNRLKALGLVDNVVLFPLGVINNGSVPEMRGLADRTPLLASFGFCLPNKGLSELVEAVSILREQSHIVRLLMVNAQHPDPASQLEIERIRALIARLGLGEQIEMRTDFLEDITCLQLLHEADLIVNPYQSSGESASAAVRFCLASGRPVAVTPIPMFDELGEAVFRMPGSRPSDIAQGIAECLNHMKNDSPEYQQVRRTARQWLDAHDFGRQAQRLMRTIRTFESEAAAASSSRSK